MSRMPGDRAQAALLRALAGVAGPFTTIAARTRPWASATFEGARHRLALRLDGPDAAARAERLGATLAEADLPMRGAFVADLVIVVTAGDGSPVLGIEALTIEEDAAGAPFTPGVRQAG